MSEKSKPSTGAHAELSKISETSSRALMQPNLTGSARPWSGESGQRDGPGDGGQGVADLVDGVTDGPADTRGGLLRGRLLRRLLGGLLLSGPVGRLLRRLRRAIAAGSAVRAGRRPLAGCRCRARSRGGGGPRSADDDRRSLGRRATVG